MMLNQISVFVENKPGKLQQLTDVLAKNNINMRALSLAEASEFGIVRIIVEDIQAASQLLTEADYIHTVTDVIGVAIPDEPGGLNHVLAILSKAGVNVEYMYAFANGADASAVLKSDDPSKVVAILKENGFDVWEADEAYRANC